MGFEYGLGAYYFQEAVRSLARLAPDAEGRERFAAAGNFGIGENDGGLAVWDGRTWQSPAGACAATTLAVTPGGELVVGGDVLLRGEPAQSGVARWRPDWVPELTSWPQPQLVCGNVTVPLRVVVDEAAMGGPVTYQWYREGERIDPSWLPTARSAELQILAARRTFSGKYMCEVRGPCSVRRTPPVRIDVLTADFADTVGPGLQDNVYDNNDVVWFIQYFFNGYPEADMGSTGGVPGGDGVLDNNDFVVFIDRFFGGC